MRVATELAADGVTLLRTVDDNGDGTGTETIYDVDGSVVQTDALTGLPVFAYPPLDATGALATLLVVEGVLPLQDAANAVHEETDHLVAEAEAWSLGNPPA